MRRLLVDKTNAVHGLLDSQGVWQMDSDVIRQIFCTCFSDLFTQCGGIEMDRILACVPPLVSLDQNAMLLQCYNPFRGQSWSLLSFLQLTVRMQLMELNIY